MAEEFRELSTTRAYMHISVESYAMWTAESNGLGAFFATNGVRKLPPTIRKEPSEAKALLENYKALQGVDTFLEKLAFLIDLAEEKEEMLVREIARVLLSQGQDVPDNLEDLRVVCYPLAGLSKTQIRRQRKRMAIARIRDAAIAEYQVAESTTPASQNVQPAGSDYTEGDND